MGVTSRQPTVIVSSLYHARVWCHAALYWCATLKWRFTNYLFMSRAFILSVWNTHIIQCNLHRIPYEIIPILTQKDGGTTNVTVGLCYKFADFKAIAMSNFPDSKFRQTPCPIYKSLLAISVFWNQKKQVWVRERTGSLSHVKYSKRQDQYKQRESHCVRAA